MKAAGDTSDGPESAYFGKWLAQDFLHPLECPQAILRAKTLYDRISRGSLRGRRILYEEASYLIQGITVYFEYAVWAPRPRKCCL